MDDSNVTARGFAAMSEEERQRIASMGGSVSPGNFKNDRAKASRAGKKGGQVSRGGGRRRT